MKHLKKLSELILESEMIYEDTSSTGGPAGSVSGGDVGSIGVSGVAYADASNTAGMGNVVSAQPSSLPGSTIGSDWSDNGGTVGSGDVSMPYNAGGGKKMFQKAEMGKNHGARTGKKSRVKKIDLKQLKGNFSIKQDYTKSASDKGSKRVMNFNDFQKDNVNKVTHVKN